MALMVTEIRVSLMETLDCSLQKAMKIDNKRT